MAEHHGGAEIPGQDVMQRVRQVSECQVLRETMENLRSWTYEMQNATLRIQSADTGTCLVDNSRRQSLTELRELSDKLVSVAENLKSAFLNHMEQRHPVFGNGRAVDSGYCGSQSTSQIISAELAIAELPRNHNSVEQPHALSLSIRGPIQEETDQTVC